jgi:gliding motility-associated-like protein
LTAGLVGKKPSCVGSSDGSIDAFVSGGISPYNYNWSEDGNNARLDNITAGLYILTVTDANNCQREFEYTLEDPDQLVVVVDTMKASTCYDNSNAFIVVEGSGGTGGYSYEWSTGETGNEITHLPAGEYHVTITDEYQCESVQGFHIYEAEQPLEILYAEINHVGCYGDNSGSLSFNISGGAPEYSYFWNDGEVSNEIYNLPAGIYQITVMDQYECTISEKFHVLQPESPLDISNTNIENVLCHGESTGLLKVQAEGGTSPYSYEWNNGTASFINDNLPAGEYSVIISDNNSCELQLTFEISEPEQISLSLSSLDNSCYNSNDGMASVSTSGGVEPYQCLWSNGANNPDIENLEAGFYSVGIKDANGCYVQAEIEINEPEQIIISANKSDILCKGVDSGEIEFDVSSVLDYTLNWEDGFTGLYRAELGQGEYNVTVLDENGCTNSAKVRLTEPEKYFDFDYESAPLTCNQSHDASILLTSMEEPGYLYEYQWNDGISDADRYDLDAGVYTVTVTNSDGCTLDKNIEITSVENECIIIPNLVTPNGDGANDSWVIENIEMFPDVTVKVFNRWGQLLFESQGYNEPWDCTYQGKKLPVSSHVYIVDLHNGTEPLQGIVSIMY